VGEREREEFVGRTLFGPGQTRWSLPVKRMALRGGGGAERGILERVDRRLGLQLTATEERLQ
jgi:hypothetical protein